MTVIEYFAWPLSFCALVINFVLFIAALLGGNLKQPLFRWFYYITLFSLLGMICDIIVTLLMGTPGTGITVLCRIFDCLSYVLAGLWFFAFSAYFYEYLRRKTGVSRRFYSFLICCGAAAVLLAVVAQFTGLYSRFDASNNYVQQPLFWVSHLFPTVSFLSCMVVTLRHIRHLKAREWIALLLYPFAPIACYVIEILYPDVWIAYAGVALTQLLIYITLHVELRTQLAEQELALQEAHVALMANQIQPHFLYNSLGSIQDLCRQEGATTAEQAVRDFSKYLRRNIDSLAQKEPISFLQELEHVELYLSLEKRRFGDNLNVIYDTPVTGFSLPAMTLQTLVENAVTYGITERVEGGTVTIITREEPKGFHITVQDDGTGVPSTLTREAERSYTSLENTRRRLALYGAALTVQRTPDVGTVAEIIIPREGA